MGTLTAQSIIDRAATILNDAGNVRWTQQELVRYLNDGQRDTVLLKPEACVKNVSVVLTASSTRQTIPSDGIALMDVVRNMGAAGTTPGRAIKVVSRDSLDINPDWHTVAADSVNGVRHFTFDARDPKHFYVYPQAPATAWYVEEIYSANPVDLPYGLADNANTGVISLDDIYANSLFEYVLFRAFSKNAEYAANITLAAAHYQAFSTSLGIKTQVDAARSPNAAIGKA